MDVKELIEDIESALQFYADGDNYYWDGCSCHGRHIMEDTGDKADNGLSSLEELKKMIGGEDE